MTGKLTQRHPTKWMRRATRQRGMPFAGWLGRNKEWADAVWQMAMPQVDVFVEDMHEMGMPVLIEDITTEVMEKFMGGHVRVTSWVDVYEADGETLWKAQVPITDGRVTVDMARAERRNFQITMWDGQGEIGYGPNVGLWYNHIIKPYRGVIGQDDGVLYAAQLGEFMIDSINRSRFPSLMEVQGRDYTKKLRQDKFTSTTTFAEATVLVVDLIQTIATNAGITKFKIEASDKTLGAPVTFERDSERWSAITTLAQSIGMEVFFDRFGYMVVRSYVDPATAPVTIDFITGVGHDDVMLYQEGWIDFPLTAGNYASVPRNNATDASADFRVDMTRPSNPSTGNKRTATGEPFVIGIDNPAGTPRLFVYIKATDGSTPTAAVNLGSIVGLVATGARMQVRGKWDKTSDVLELYWRVSGDLEDDTGWTLLDTQTHTGKAVSNTITTWELSNSSATESLNADIFRAMFRHNNNAYTDINMSTDFTVGNETTFTSASGHLVTIFRSGSPQTTLNPAAWLTKEHKLPKRLMEGFALFPNSTNANNITWTGTWSPGDIGASMRIDCERPPIDGQVHRVFGGNFILQFTATGAIEGYVQTGASTWQSVSCTAATAETTYGMPGTGTRLQFKVAWNTSSDTLKVYWRPAEIWELESELGWVEIATGTFAGSSYFNGAHLLGMGQTGFAYDGMTWRAIVMRDSSTPFTAVDFDLRNWTDVDAFEIPNAGTLGGVGTITRSLPTPLTLVAAEYFSAHESGNLIEYQRKANDSRLFNEVVVRGSGSNNGLVFGRAENTNSQSPTHWTKVGHRVMPPIENPLVATNDDAEAIAAAILNVAGLESYDVSMEALVAPWLEAAECCTFIPTEGVTDEPTRFLLTDFTIPLKPGEQMDATARRVYAQPPLPGTFGYGTFGGGTFGTPG